MCWKEKTELEEQEMKERLVQNAQQDKFTHPAQ